MRCSKPASRPIVLRGLGAGALFLALTACPRPEVRTVTEYVEVPVPVTAGCVVDRPAPPEALRERYTAEQWAAMPPGVKAAALGAQAGRRLNYEDRLAAATSACPDAE